MLQKRPGSLTADQASCPGARAPAPVPQQEATLREVPAALEAPGALDGAGAGAGARAKGRGRNVERWGLGYASNGSRRLGGVSQGVTGNRKVEKGFLSKCQKEGTQGMRGKGGILENR